MRRRRYAILGTGAVGGYYGARLAHAGCDVHFLLHRDHEHVRREGLRVDSVEGDFSLASPNAYASAEAMPACDVAVVSVKSTQNHLLPTLLPPALRPDGVVLVLQNGLGVDEQAAAVAGADRVLGGLCFVCSNKVEPGHIRHLDFGAITLGAFEPDPARPGRGVTAAVRRVADDLTRAGIRVLTVDDLLLARWQKLVWNIPFNGLSVVLDATTDRIMADPAAAELAEALMREVVDGAAAFGRTIDDGFVQRRLDDTRRMFPYNPSMRLDHQHGRPMELGAIFEAPVRRAASRGVGLPRIEMLWRQLCFLDRAAQRTERQGTCVDQNR